MKQVQVTRHIDILHSSFKIMGSFDNIQFSGSVYHTDLLWLYASVNNTYGNDFLMFTDSQRRDVFLMKLTGGNHIGLSTNLSMKPIAVDYDPIQRNIFWTLVDANHNSEKFIYRYLLEEEGHGEGRKLSRGMDQFNYIPIC